MTLMFSILREQVFQEVQSQEKGAEQRICHFSNKGRRKSDSEEGFAGSISEDSG